MPKFLDRLLVVVALVGAMVGGFFAVQSGGKRVELEREIQRLEQKIGILDVKDPDRIYIVAIKGDVPFEFAWRIHLPANCKSSLYESFGRGSSTSGLSQTNPQDFVARIKIKVDRGRLLAVSKFGNRGGNISGGSDGLLFKAVSERDMSVIRITRVGEDGPESYAIDEEFVLLSIDEPKDESDSTNKEPGFQCKFVK